MNALHDLPSVLTLTQAAKALGVDRRTIDRWAAQGRIRKVKLSPGKTGTARILKDSLVELIERGSG
jgi:excisionase family DNA binding protein